MTDSNKEPSDSEVLKSACRESREVLNHRIELVSKMDDIAMHTVRTSVILIGILVSAAGIAGQPAISSLPIVSLVTFGLGGFALILTIFYGVTMLTISDYSFGLSMEQRRWARDRDLSQITWYRSVLGEYDDWIDDMRDTNEKNSNILLVVLSLFIGGTTLIATGAAYMVVRTFL